MNAPGIEMAVNMNKTVKNKSLVFSPGSSIMTELIKRINGSNPNINKAILAVLLMNITAPRIFGY